MFAPKVRRPQAAHRVPLTTIDAAVSAHLGTTRVSGNAQPAAFKRQGAMYLAKHISGWSTTRIGKFNSGRDHSTVCYAPKRIEALREADPEIEGLLSNFTDEIRSAPVPSPNRQRTEDVHSRGSSSETLSTSFSMLWRIELSNDFGFEEWGFRRELKNDERSLKTRTLDCMTIPERDGRSAYLLKRLVLRSVYTCRCNTRILRSAN